MFPPKSGHGSGPARATTGGLAHRHHLTHWGKSNIRAPMEVNLPRLRSTLEELATIGATPAGGVTRTTLSDEDRRARDLFASWCRGSGLTVRVDDMGTQYARLEGREPDLDPILIGSHLDSVPAGGKFDGPL